MKKYIKEYNRNHNRNFAQSIWNNTGASISSIRDQLYTERKKILKLLKTNKRKIKVAQ